MMPTAGGMPVLILKEGTERARGKSAQLNNIAAAKAIADAVRSTLGPKGMDKMLVDSMGDIVITNDGVTILKKIEVDHPAAKMLVESAKSQDQECGDGTTSAIVLAGELLKKAETLIEQNVHPTIIASGFRLAAEEAVRLLNKICFEVSPDDYKTLNNIAKTAMGSKGIVASQSEREHLADIAVNAAKAVYEKRAGKPFVPIDNIKIEKKHGGSVSDTKLIDGIVVDKERVHPRMPKIIKNAKIALINCPIEVKKTETKGEIAIRDPKQLQKFLEEEEQGLIRMVKKISECGANVLFCEKGIDDLAQHYLAKNNMIAARRLKEEDMKKLARATGGRIVTSIDDLTSGDLGSAKNVEEIKIGDTNMLFITGCEGAKAVTVLVRGGTEHVVDEVERAVNDAVKVVKLAIEDGKALCGGGSTEIETVLHLQHYASTIGGREQLAIEQFASSLEIVPWALAENAGLDAMHLLIKLKSKHGGKAKNVNMGINIFKGEITDMKAENVIEPLKVKTHALMTATEVATMILRIDDVIASKKAPPPSPPRGPPGAPGAPGMGMPPPY
jgi:thermosome